MPIIRKQGTVSLVGTTILEIPQYQTVQVTGIRFNNAAAYDLKLEKFDFATGTTLTIYDLTLSAGDTVTDDFPYIMTVNDKLIATSSIAGTTFFVNAISIQ